VLRGGARGVWWLVSRSRDGAQDRSGKAYAVALEILLFEVIEHLRHTRNPLCRHRFRLLSFYHKSPFLDRGKDLLGYACAQGQVSVFWKGHTQFALPFSPPRIARQTFNEAREQTGSPAPSNPAAAKDRQRRSVIVKR
jgi:hypothetical protein